MVSNLDGHVENFEVFSVELFWIILAKNHLQEVSVRRQNSV